MEDPEDEFDGDVLDPGDDPVGPVVLDEDFDDPTLPDKRLRRDQQAAAGGSSDNDHRAEFAHYARPTITVLPDSLEFMLIDVECITARVRNDMDDPSADHSPVLPAVVTATTKYKRRTTDPFVIGPVIKIYGTCSDETSVCVDIYGCYPAFRMQVVRGTPSSACLERVKNYVEKTVLCPKGGILPDKPRNVVKASMVQAFSAFPYCPTPSTFYEFKLARPHSVRAMAEHFVKVTEFDDDYSEGGVFGFIPHSGEDALTQYVVDSGISGFGWVSASNLDNPSDSGRSESETSTCNYTGDCRKCDVNPIEGRDSVVPLRVMGIDIECIKNEGMPDPHKNPIIIIGVVVCRAVNGVIDPASMRNIIFTWFPPGSGGVDEIPSVHQTIAVDNEIEMLRAFAAFFTTYDTDIIIGHNIVGFDIPYIVTRANTLGIEEAMYMGRRRDQRWTAPREITRMRKNGDTRKSLRAETPGRIQLDTLPFMQGARKESSYRLGSLAQKYLGEGKDDVGYQMINPLWRQSPQTRSRLCSYCLKDVQLSLGLAMCKDFEMVLSVIELARSTRVRAPQLLRSGNQEKVKTLVLHAAKDPRFDQSNLPVFFPYETPKPRSKDDKFQGAIVINPKRGARKKKEPVATGDFSSLYPSIMISNNMCYSTMIGVPRRAPAPEGAPPHHTAPDTGTHFVHKEVRMGLLPRILEDLLARRSAAKAMIKSDPDPAHKRMYDSRQLQLKIVANSVYGVLSASGGWFVRMEMGESVTSWGRSMISKAMNIAKASPFNADVIYGDTDSIMMVFPGCTTVPDAFERLKHVCDAVTAAFPKPVSMAAEKVYEGHLQFGKKRYAGFCHIPPGKPKIDSKGVEKNRLDNCPLVRRMMSRVFELLLIDEDVPGALAYVHQCVTDLIQGKVDFADLVITKSISKVEYKSKAVHVEVAKRMKERDPSYLMAPGERIPYVIVKTDRGKCSGVKVFDKAEDPLWSIQHDMDIDVEHYIRDISRPLARTLMWYIAPKEMLEGVKTLEARIAEVFGRDPGTEAELEKALKKHLEKMTDYVANHLFGPGALAKISRPPQKRSGPIAKFLAPAAKKDRSSPADMEHLESLRAQLLEAKAKCTRCRGREDDTVACVQRDCTNLFQIAILTKDIEELVK